MIIITYLQSINQYASFLLITFGKFFIHGIYIKLLNITSTSFQKFRKFSQPLVRESLQQSIR